MIYVPLDDDCRDLQINTKSDRNTNAADAIDEERMGLAYSRLLESEKLANGTYDVLTSCTVVR
jgi:hypothetical protein